MPQSNENLPYDKQQIELYVLAWIWKQYMIIAIKYDEIAIKSIDFLPLKSVNVIAHRLHFTNEYHTLSSKKNGCWFNKEKSSRSLNKCIYRTNRKDESFWVYHLQILRYLYVNACYVVLLFFIIFCRFEQE